MTQEAPAYGLWGLAALNSIVFLLIGFLAARVVPGDVARVVCQVPPSYCRRTPPRTRETSMQTDELARIMVDAEDALVLAGQGSLAAQPEFETAGTGTHG